MASGRHARGRKKSNSEVLAGADVDHDATGPWSMFDPRPVAGRPGRVSPQILQKYRAVRVALAERLGTIGIYSRLDLAGMLDRVEGM